MRRTNLYLDPDTIRALKIVAAHEDASVSDVVRQAIDLMLEKRKISTDTENATQEMIESDVSDAARESRLARNKARAVGPKPKAENV